MSFNEQVSSVHANVGKLESRLNSQKCSSLNEEFAKSRALVEIEKVRSNLLIAEALEHLAINTG